MTTKYKPYTIDELVTEIYEDNQEHFQTALEDCDCVLHQAMWLIVTYWEGN